MKQLGCEAKCKWFYGDTTTSSSTGWKICNNTPEIQYTEVEAKSSYTLMIGICPNNHLWLARKSKNKNKRKTSYLRTKIQ